MSGCLLCLYSSGPPVPLNLPLNSTVQTTALQTLCLVLKITFQMFSTYLERRDIKVDNGLCLINNSERFEFKIRLMPSFELNLSSSGWPIHDILDWSRFLFSFLCLYNGSRVWLNVHKRLKSYRSGQVTSLCKLITFINKIDEKWPFHFGPLKLCSLKRFYRR